MECIDLLHGMMVYGFGKKSNDLPLPLSKDTVHKEILDANLFVESDPIVEKESETIPQYSSAL